MKMKNVWYLAIAGLIAFSACGPQETKDSKAEEVATPNTLTEKDIEDGWVLLFDGESTDQWRGYCKDEFPKGWVVEDGTIQCLGSGRGEAGSGGDIITKEKFGNFELSLEWKVSEGGNSGIFYLAQEFCEEGNRKPIWQSSPEMQILDNEKHPDARLGVEGNRQAGSLYDLIPADPQNAKPAGEWNHVKILVYKGTVTHWMNGETVVEYHLWTDKWYDMVENSKFKDYPSFVDPAPEGHVGLQDHGDDVWFRNIKIREL